MLSYVTPEKWKTAVDPKDGSISMNSADERISVNFGEVPGAASMEMFEQMLPAMTKVLKDPVVAQEAKELTEDGLSGFTATYAGKIGGKATVCIFVLFKDGKERSILGNMIMSEPQTLPKEDNDAFEKFMKSMKGVAK